MTRLRVPGPEGLGSTSSLHVCEAGLEQLTLWVSDVTSGSGLAARDMEASLDVPHVLLSRGDGDSPDTAEAGDGGGAAFRGILSCGGELGSVFSSFALRGVGEGEVLGRSTLTFRLLDLPCWSVDSHKVNGSETFRASPGSVPGRAASDGTDLGLGPIFSPGSSWLGDAGRVEVVEEV
eukprot:CAMPEP_0181410750 /NCGR_PEP_ID=MMETSP1110-20121109/7502_1 /TAXON_ID=174948 /ORGANISM="Symbiodinium sp., Strain CCMP421" /LENGTH=177 /DNA_ID=CAMNT_0023533311 /DNA_START=276 /DNA_END=811 /DNA_ORIENTATION=-